MPSAVCKNLEMEEPRQSVLGRQRGYTDTTNLFHRRDRKLLYTHDLTQSYLPGSRHVFATMLEKGMWKRHPYIIPQRSRFNPRLLSVQSIENAFLNTRCPMLAISMLLEWFSRDDL